MVTETNNNRDPLNGAAVTGAALGGSALLVQLLSGTLGNVLGGGNKEPVATQREVDFRIAAERTNTEKDAVIGQLKAEKYADAAALATERRLADKIEKIETSMTAGFARQGEYNVANTAAVASIQNQTRQLMGLTGLIINGPAMAASEAAAAPFTAKTAAASTGG